VIRVVLVDDQALLRTGFRMILESQPDIEVVGEAGDGAAGVKVVAEQVPDVVLMDVRMPGTDGIVATERISASTPQSRVLVLTTFDLDEYVYAGLRAGASGFLLKDAPPEHLLDAVRVVAGGEAVLAPSATRRLLDRFVPALPADTAPAGSADRTGARDRLGQLTDREREVFALIAAARSNREIAKQLHLSEGTVKVHVSRLLAKLELRDRVQAVVLAYEAGIVRPGRPGQL
jgi:DNA-binding NarL/FixJ family response regulator